jgi:hypothetical protein
MREKTMKYSRWRVGVIFCLCLPALAGNAAENAAEVNSASSEVRSATPTGWFDSLKVSGSWHSTYSFRTRGGQDDSDLYEFFSLRMTDIVKDRVDAAMSMFWYGDLDGGTRLDPGQNYDPFFDLDSTTDRFRFYTGYVDIKGLGFDKSRLRLGRQYLEGIDYSHFDGATYRFNPIDPLEVTLFGGRPISYFSSNDGDAFYGSNIQYRFTPQTKAAVRYYRYDTSFHNDDLAAAELWHLFSPNSQAHVEFSLLDGDPYLFKTDYYGMIDSIDLDALIQVVHLFETINNHTIDFDPYFPLLNGYEPFTYGSLLLTKGLGKQFRLLGGIDFRTTDRALDPVSADTNREYRRGSLGLEWLPNSLLSVSVRGELWDVDPRDRFTGVSGEVEYRPTKQWALSAGAEYGEYVQHYRDEFLLLFGDDRMFRISPEAITYYARVRWKPTSRIFTSATFELEDENYDPSSYYSIRLEMGLRF